MEVKNEARNKGNGGVGIAWLGAILMYIGQWVSYIWDYWLMLLMIGMAVAIVGCVLWAQRKNRHWAFGFWGILAPVGFLGISLLKEK